MKKLISIFLCIGMMLLSLSGCTNSHSKYETNKIAKSLQYYNQKAIDNIDGLIGLKHDKCKDWIYDTYSKDEIIETEFDLADNPNQLSFLSKDKNIKIFFIFEKDFNRFFIEPNLDNSPDATYEQFASAHYKKTVDNYCSNTESYYKDAPTICELALYNFDKANKDTQLVYFYLFHKDIGWGWLGDEGPYNSISFEYDNNAKEFKCCY